jgi:YbbR-like protein
VSAPVEFVGVPKGMDVSGQSAERLEVQVRGGSWLMDSVSLTRIVAHFNLRGAQAGALDLAVDEGNLDLPPGIVMERVSPARITVLLAPTKR